jgi:hypothetical protein
MTPRTGKVLTWRYVAALGWVTLAGCGGPELVPVHGSVLYNDRPLEYGSVMLQPVGGGEIARGTIQPDGTFALSFPDGSAGAAPGTYLVRVTSYEAQRAQSLGATEREPALGRSAIPERYTSFRTSGLQVDVTPGMELPLVLTLGDE